MLSKWIKWRCHVLKLSLSETIMKKIWINELTVVARREHRRWLGSNFRAVSFCQLSSTDFVLAIPLKVFFWTEAQAWSPSSTSLTTLLPLTLLLMLVFFHLVTLELVPFRCSFSLSPGFLSKIFHPQVERPLQTSRSAFPPSLCSPSSGDLSCWCGCKYYLHVNCL